VAAFQGETPQNDDITLVVMKYLLDSDLSK
jgi:serine phosphatase RsbU (regulator of sigma subunit)